MNKMLIKEKRMKIVKKYRKEKIKKIKKGMKKESEKNELMMEELQKK